MIQLLFEFNFYSALLLIPFVQGIIFFVLLWYRGMREERISDKLLGSLILLFSLHIAQYMLGFAGWYDSRDHYSTFMFYFPFHHLMMFGPLIYFYFRSITKFDFKLNQRYRWHFAIGLIPFLCYLITFIIDILVRKELMGIPFSGHFGTKGNFQEFMQNNIWDIFEIIGIVSLFIYMIMTLREYHLYKKYIKNTHSSIDNISYKWLRNTLYVLLIGFSIDWTITIVDIFAGPLNYIQNWTSFIVLGVVVYIISIIGYISSTKLPASLNFIPETIKDKPEPVEKIIFPDLEVWKNKVEQHMKKETPYLNAELTLSELARQLSTNNSILSKVINSGFNQNFNDFINAFRVNAVKDKLRKNNHHNFTLMAIALDSGFNSKATFNRAFRKFTGGSPKEFISGLKKTV